MCDFYHYDMVKCCRNRNTDTEPSIEKNDGISLVWQIFKEYIKQSIIKIVLRKTNSHSIGHLQIYKKINNVQVVPTRKTDSNFDFSEAV